MRSTELSALILAISSRRARIAFKATLPPQEAAPRTPSQGHPGVSTRGSQSN